MEDSRGKYINDNQPISKYNPKNKMVDSDEKVIAGLKIVKNDCCIVDYGFYKLPSKDTNLSFIGVILV